MAERGSWIVGGYRYLSLCPRRAPIGGDCHFVRGVTATLSACQLPFCQLRKINLCRLQKPCQTGKLPFCQSAYLENMTKWQKN